MSFDAPAGPAERCLRPVPEADAGAEHSGPRILLYSHDSWGIGHLRRTLAIAGALSNANATSNLLIVSGSPCATQFALPERCDLVKLPAVTKDAAGNYISRQLSMPLTQMMRLRQQILMASYRAFDPDVVVIDHQVVGMLGECLDLLKEAGKRGASTIFGLRDILDSRDAVSRSWTTPACQWALANAYDAICVYGSQEVFDPRVEYPLLQRYRDRVRFTGYIVATENASCEKRSRSRARVLVTMGGGEDGAARIDRYLEALELRRVDWDSEIITGPLVADSVVQRYRNRAKRLKGPGHVNVRKFSHDVPRLLRNADTVVSMAGYNTCAEILQSGCPAVLLPRTEPRKEQLIRASRLSALGLAETLIAPTAAELRRAIETSLDRERDTTQVPRLDGLSSMCSVVDEMISQSGRFQIGEIS